MHICLELVKELRYNLSMMGVSTDGLEVFLDNMSVLNGVSIQEAKFSKNHLGICYHAARESYLAYICKGVVCEGNS